VEGVNHLDLAAEAARMASILEKRQSGGW